MGTISTYKASTCYKGLANCKRMVKKITKKSTARFECSAKASHVCRWEPLTRVCVTRKSGTIQIIKCLLTTEAALFTVGQKTLQLKINKNNATPQDMKNFIPSFRYVSVRC